MDAAEAPPPPPSPAATTTASNVAADRRRLPLPEWQRCLSAVGRFADEKVGRIARDDPRRVAHSFKVGLALTLVSVLYYVTPLFNGFASAATFSRFIPEIKARYDYGVGIFILTFSLVAVSSYRVEELMPLALQRTSTIFVGVAICLCTTVLVFPVWAGDDLHKLAGYPGFRMESTRMETECFGENARSGNLEGKDFHDAYMSILSSKDKEDSLYPEANPQLYMKVQKTCSQMSMYSARTLRELSSAVRSMTTPSAMNKDLSAAMKSANGCRNELLQDSALLQVMHIAVVASHLSDMVTQINEITESVNNLARLARFKNPEKERNDVVINVRSQ
nr:unnamed protein product [Digitaria exilis]